MSSLDLKVTTHRIHLFNPQNKVANFEILFSQIGLISSTTSGIFSKKVSKIVIVLKDNSVVEISKQDNDHKELLQLIEKAFHSKEWEKKSMVVKDKDALQRSGFQSMIDREQQKMQETSFLVKSSFGDLDDLMKSVNELKEIINFVKKDAQGNSQNDEVEEILKNMGCFSIITKDEAGEKFFEQVARQVNDLMKVALFIASLKEN